MFAVTINKTQKQTFKRVGTDLKQYCYSHGQLYVALSRSSCDKNQYIQLLLKVCRSTLNYLLFIKYEMKYVQHSYCVENKIQIKVIKIKLK